MKNNTKKTLKIYLEHVKKYRVLFFVIVFCIIGGSFVNSIIPVFFKDFFDTLSSGGEKDKIFINLIKILIFIVALDFLKWVFFRLSGFLSSYFFPKIMADLSNTCFSCLHNHSFSFFNNNFSGSLVKKVNYFINSFEALFDIFFWNILRLSVGIFTVLIVLILKNYILGIAVFLWICFYVLANFLFSKFKFKYDVEVNKIESKTSGFLADTIANNSVVKLFNGRKRESSSFFNINDKLRKKRTFLWNLDNIFESIQSFLMIVLQASLFIVAILLWKKGLFTIGDFVLIQSYAIIVIMGAWEFGWIIRKIYRALSNAEEMSAILNLPNEIKDSLGAKEIKVKKGIIEFKDVDFFYHQTRKVLDKFNLVINSGEKIALIGPSGAGKSTIAKLLLRNHDISGGKILIDGQDISKVMQESLWKNIGLVPQDSILFHRSLKENIGYGKPGASDKEIMEAAKLAHCHEFIKEFPDGYETFVGERGVKLSGGERQRVAIARAILKNAPILILDEATSSLDSQSEKYIQDALEKLMKGKTVIVIAHRLSTIKKMDRIVYIDEGRIKEEGAHKDLKEDKNGFYKKLWEIQAGGFIE